MIGCFHRCFLCSGRWWMVNRSVWSGWLSLEEKLLENVGTRRHRNCQSRSWTLMCSCCGGCSFSLSLDLAVILEWAGAGRLQFHCIELDYLGWLNGIQIGCSCLCCLLLYHGEVFAQTWWFVPFICSLFEIHCNFQVWAAWWCSRLRHSSNHYLRRPSLLDSMVAVGRSCKFIPLGCPASLAAMAHSRPDHDKSSCSSSECKIGFSHKTASSLPSGSASSKIDWDEIWKWCFHLSHQTEWGSRCTEVSLWSVSFCLIQTLWSTYCRFIVGYNLSCRSKLCWRASFGQKLSCPFFDGNRCSVWLWFLWRCKCQML